MRRKHPSKKAREKAPRSQDRKECALRGNSENGQRDQRIPRRGAVDEVRGGGPRSYKHLQATARIWDLTKIKQFLGFRFV